MIDHILRAHAKAHAIVAGAAARKELASFDAGTRALQTRTLLYDQVLPRHGFTKLENRVTGFDHYQIAWDKSAPHELIAVPRGFEPSQTIWRIAHVLAKSGHAPVIVLRGPQNTPYVASGSAASEALHALQPLPFATESHVRAALQKTVNEARAAGIARLSLFLDGNQLWRATSDQVFALADKLRHEIGADEIQQIFLVRDQQWTSRVY